MATGRRRDEWDYWAFIAAWLAKIVADADVNPEKLNPIRNAERRRNTNEDLERQRMREAFCSIGISLGDTGAVKKWLSADQAKADLEKAGTLIASAPERPMLN